MKKDEVAKLLAKVGIGIVLGISSGLLQKYLLKKTDAGIDNYYTKKNIKIRKEEV